MTWLDCAKCAALVLIGVCALIIFWDWWTRRRALRGMLMLYRDLNRDKPGAFKVSRHD